MGTTLNNLGACAQNLLTGKKFGEVMVNGKRTLIPSQRLTKLVDGLEKHGFGFDTVHGLSAEQAQEYARRLGSAGKGFTTKPCSMYTYMQAHGGTQICEISKKGKKPVIDIVERVSSPTKEVFRGIGEKIKTSAKSIGSKFKSLGKKLGTKLVTVAKSVGSWLKSILPKLKAIIK